MLPDTLGPLEEIARRLGEYNKRLESLERLEKSLGLTLIEDIFLTAPQATIDFQNIPAIYKHLKATTYLRASHVATLDNWEVRFNNDSANNYTAGYISHDAAGAQFPAFAAALSAVFGGFLPAAQADAFLFSASEFEIPNYANTINYKTLRGTCVMNYDNNVPQNMFFVTAGGSWRSSAAINRVTIVDTGGAYNFVAGSRVSLYGMA